MPPEILIIAYGITIVGSAVAGCYLTRLFQMNHVRMQFVLSFVGGMMLGVATLHLLPHAFSEINRVQRDQSTLDLKMGDTTADTTGDGLNAPVAESESSSETEDRVAKLGLSSMNFTMRAALAGLLVTFFLMRAFHFHQHGDDHGEHEHVNHDHPNHDHSHSHSHQQAPSSKLGWLGVLFGLGVHTFMDGVTLGASVSHDYRHHMSTVPAGFGVYIAILLHKPLDALSLATLMTAQRMKWRSVLLANICIALTCLVGALSVLYLPGIDSGIKLGCLLAASAGVFLCISLSDLLPEVQFHRHDRLHLSTSLLLGIGIAFLIELLH